MDMRDNYKGYDRRDRETQKGILHVLGVTRQRTHEPKENHVDEHASPSEDGRNNTSGPHRIKPSVISNDDIRTRALPENARIAVAVVEEI